MDGAPDINCSAQDTINNILYLGGYFNRVNQYETHAIIKFDGTNFDTLQSGLDGDSPGSHYCRIRTMSMYKGKLYVFGDFFTTGHVYSPNMGVWNGTSWEPQVAIGYPDFAYIKNGSMYVWGFDSINGLKITGLARFDGTTWHDEPTPNTPGHTASFVLDFQNKIYKSGQVTPSSSDANLSYSDGTNWIPWVGISGDANKAVFGMKVIDSLMWVYGRFYSIAGTHCAGMAAWNGTRWYGFGQGISTAGGWETVYDIQKIDGNLYAVGLFDNIEGIGNSNFSKMQSTNIARFDGEKWCLFSPPSNNVVTGITKFRNDLYMFGAFEKIGNDTIRSIGKYNEGFSEICSSPIAIAMSTVGINEIIKDENLKMYPNPVKDYVTIEFSEIDASECKLEIINIIGQKVFQNQYSLTRQEIDLKILPNGIYYVKIKNSNSQKISKLIKE